MRKVNRRSGCPISFALDVFGDKWSLLVIRDMIFEGKSSFNSFLVSDEKIATNILSSRLKILEKRRVIKIIHDERDRRRHVYALTEQGLDLLPILVELTLWSSKHNPESGRPDDFVKAALRDKAGLIRKIKKGINKSRYYCA